MIISATVAGEKESISAVGRRAPDCVSIVIIIIIIVVVIIIAIIVTIPALIHCIVIVIILFDPSCIAQLQKAATRWRWSSFCWKIVTVEQNLGLGQNQVDLNSFQLEVWAQRVPRFLKQYWRKNIKAFLKIFRYYLDQRLHMVIEVDNCESANCFYLSYLRAYMPLFDPVESRYK